MPPIIYKMDFVDRKKFNNSYKRRKKNLSDALNYIKRKKAIEKNVEKFDSLKGQLKYISRANANKSDILYFNNSGAVRDKKTFEEHLELLDEHQKLKKMCLYRNYISFDESTEENILKNYSQEELFGILQPILEMQLIDEGFNLDNVVYSAQFHTNTKHLHMHFDFFEKVPTKKKNKRQLEVKEKYLKKMNFMLASNEEQKLNILDQQKELRPKIKKAKEDVLVFFFHASKDPKIVNCIKTIKKGKYPYLKQAPEEVKEIIEKIAYKYEKEYLKDLKIDIESLGEDYKKAYNEEDNKYSYNELNKIRINLRNTIFREMKSYQPPNDYPKEINTPFKKKFYAGIQNKKSLNNKKKINSDLEKMAGLKNLWGVNIFDKYKRM